MEALQETAINDFYEAIAQLLHTQSRNIAFAHDATSAYIQALSAIPFEKGDVIITSQNDYSSNQIQFLSLQKRFGVVVKRIRPSENGDLDINDFQSLIKEKRPKLVAITHVPTNSGLIQNVEEIGRICRAHEIIYLVDACQSVGQLVVDVSRIQCDFLSATGRKFMRGPRGTGFLYVSDRVLEMGLAPLFVDGCGATWTAPNEYELDPTARRFHTWEKPYALVMGLKAAAQYACQIGLENIENRNRQLMTRLGNHLDNIPGVTTFDKGDRRCNILTFRKANKSEKRIAEVFSQHQVYFGISTLEWGVIDYADKGVDWTVRVSPHYFNTVEEMDRLAEIIEGI